MTRKTEPSRTGRRPKVPAPGTLAARLLAARVGKGWTLDELAERSGLARAYVGRIAAGSAEPGRLAVIQIATALGVRPDALKPDQAAHE